MEKVSEAKPSRRPLRLSVRALMVTVLLLALALGWMVQRVQVQREAVAAIRASGGSVVYDWQRIPGKRIDIKAEPNAPKWLVERLGVDYFGDVVVASLGNNPGDADLDRVGRLAKLVTIQIGQSNEITDAGLAHLAGLIYLENLSLRGTKVTGPGLANLRSMTRLKTLSLSGLPLNDADLAHIEGLTDLETLDLSGVPVTDVGLAHLQGLVKLQQLRLNGSRVTGPGLAHLKGMTRLKNLGLMRTPLLDLSSLPPLPGLQLLFLDGTQVEDSHLASLAKLPALETLGLNQTGITDAGLANLQGVKGSLKRLALSRTKVSDAAAPALLELENLTSLLLNDTKVTDAMIDRLSGLKGLRSLDVNKTAATNAGLARLRQALPQLELTQEPAARMARPAASRPPTQDPQGPLK
jgi:hypothetical protein